jgi:hypothetical protein
LLLYDEEKNAITKMIRLSKKASFWQKSIQIFSETAKLSAQKM